jgi:hypothetical protein
MREDAIRQAGRYIFFLPTIHLLNEQVADFEKDVTRLLPNGPKIVVYEAHSGKGHGGVQRKLDDARAAIEASGAAHAIIFTTHDALTTKDLSSFKDWHARVDEAPNAVKGGSISVVVSKNLLGSYFDLTPVDDTGWSNLTLKGPAPKWPKVARDELLKGQVDFIKLISSPGGVFVNTDQWSTVDNIEWWWVWSPSALKDFATVEIAGASYHTSLGAIAARRWFANSIRLIDLPTTMTRTGQPTVRVHFFTRGHKPSTTLWERSHGRKMIKAVADYLASAEPDLGFWSGNDEVLRLMEWRVPGDRTPSKVMGQNKWRDLTKCAFIFSSGSTPQDRAIMDTFEISESDVLRAREQEDILQFAMRGAIRKPEFGENYDVYVYSEEQARALAASLTDSGIGTVKVIPATGAGIMNETDGKSGKKRSIIASTPSPQPAIKKVMNPRTGKLVLPKSLKRDTQRAIKASGKVKRPRGRPPKNSSTP